MKTRQALMEAWAERFNRTRREVFLAHNHPALFKPEYRDELMKRADEERRHWGYWKASSDD